MENPTKMLFPEECIAGDRTFYLIMVDNTGSCVRFETDYCGKAERIGYDFEKRGYTGTLLGKTTKDGHSMMAVLRHFGLGKETT